MQRDALSRAKATIDLPQLVRDMGVRLREGRTHAGQTYYTAHCPFHDDRNPSFSLVRYEDGWGWKCHAGCGSGSVVDFIMKRDGVSRGEAVRRTLELAGLEHEAASIARRVRLRSVGGETSDAVRGPGTAVEEAGGYKAPPEIPEDVLARLHAARERLEDLDEPPPILRRYGITLETASLAHMGIEEDGGILIPLYSVWGTLLNVKKRNAHNNPRYQYIASGLGSHPWRSPSFQPSTGTVLIVEGELNAVAAFQALYARRERIGVLGMPGASASLGDWAQWLESRDVFIYADPDEPGEAARERWVREARAAGAARVYVMPALPTGLGEDYADILAATGTERLGAYLVETIGEIRANAVVDAEEEIAEDGMIGGTLDLTTEPPPVRWVVSDIIQRGKINLWAAYGGVGKSALAAHLAVSVQSGLPFLEHRTFPVAGVVVIDYEDDPDAFIRWARRSARGLGVSIEDIDIHYVSAVTHPRWRGRPFIELVGDIRADIERLGGEWLIVIDTFESALQLDSISGQDVLEGMRILRTLTDAGHTILALDHLPKLTKGTARENLMPIGSVQKTNQARSVLVIEDVTPEGYGDASLLKFRAVKINATKRWEPFGVRREVGGGRVIYELADLPNDTGRPADKRLAVREVIIGVLLGGAALSFEEIHEAVAHTGASERTIRRTISEMVQSGDVIRERAGWPARVVYRLAPGE